jgi:hypothetical protein
VKRTNICVGPLRGDPADTKAISFSHAEWNAVLALAKKFNSAVLDNYLTPFPARKFGEALTGGWRTWRPSSPRRPSRRSPPARGTSGGRAGSSGPSRGGS